ncbi:MAG: acetyl-CoA carboxylase biotin carboxyl carrier protein [bacterium]|nr:acetyl-CoA carboxylase biotin carboxyl carrier protein [bacterium]
MNIKDLKGIKSLALLMGTSDLTEITIEEDGVKLTLKRERTAAPASAPVAHQVMVPAAAPAAATAAPAPAAAAPSASPVEDNLHYVTAPLVGTFYGSPSPDSDAYVNVGDKVKKGQTLCIIEAMKLMNEIESDVDGTVVEMLVENATPVDFGARIFAIKPN